LFLALNGAWLFQGGVRFGGDSPLYVQSADRLIQGEPLQPELRSRLCYIALVALARASGLGLGSVVLVQVLVAGLAACALYDLGRRLGGPWAGLLAAALSAANPDVVRWHAYILTDSLYISAVPLAVWCIFTARGRRARLAAAVLVLAAALLRPNGWLLVLVAGSFWTGGLLKGRATRGVALAALAAGFVLAFFTLLSFQPRLLTNPPDEMLRRGEVIWGYPPARLPMPPHPAREPAGLPGALGYALGHPLATARLAAARVGTELTHTRPFYSAAHNAALLVLLLPLYPCAAVGFFRTRRSPLTRLLGAVIVSHLLVQAVTYADWDGRFLLYVFPLIGVLGAAGAAAFLPLTADRRGQPGESKERHRACGIGQGGIQEGLC
jgi:4-amino-4-deoxy-L-arabinose transferase-like glycosyltransferase